MVNTCSCSLTDSLLQLDKELNNHWGNHLMLHSALAKHERLTFQAPEIGAKDEVNVITMVCLWIERPDMLDEAGQILELIEVDRSMGTWR